MIEHEHRLAKKGRSMKPQGTYPKLCCGVHSIAKGGRWYECRVCGTVRSLATGERVAA